MTQPAITAKAIRWQCGAFGDLGVGPLYAVLQLRSAVFVVEQSCIFQDMDGADPLAVHLLGWAGEELAAYARCLPARLKFAEASIGRVLVARHFRGSGLGHILMQRATGVVEQQWGAQPIRIGAQARLAQFYEKHGFHADGLQYLEDGIAHIDMLKN